MYKYNTRLQCISRLHESGLAQRCEVKDITIEKQGVLLQIKPLV